MSERYPQLLDPELEPLIAVFAAVAARSKSDKLRQRKHARLAQVVEELERRVSSLFSLR